jgi:hypothetical protein
MALHLIKLCVGAERVEDLEDWFESGRADWKGPRGIRAVAHLTRQVPKRAKELLAGGSLYWVIKGRIQTRQRLISIDSTKDEEGRPRCALVMDRKLILTRPRAHRPFQGWRYLEATDAPPDIGPYKSDGGQGNAGLKAELLELGLIRD